MLNAKQTIIDTVNELPDDASWADVQRVVNNEIHNNDKGSRDGYVDAASAMVVIVVLALALVFWISG